MHTISNLMNRIYNWKFRSAYRMASGMVFIPYQFREAIERLAIRYEDCGCQDGEAFEGLSDIVTFITFAPEVDLLEQSRDMITRVIEEGSVSQETEDALLQLYNDIEEVT